MPSSPRRFPSPWSAELQPNYYVVRDADGQQIAYIYYSNDPDRRAAAKLLTKDEDRRIAVNLVKLPDVSQNENEQRNSHRFSHHRGGRLSGSSPLPDGPLFVPALGGRLAPPLALTLLQALSKHSVQSSPRLVQQ